MLRHTQTLSENWEWKQRDLKIANLLDELKAPSVSIKEDSKDTRSTWRKANTSPSEIHTELLKAGLIPDPYKGFNEHKVQCGLNPHMLKNMLTPARFVQGSGRENGSIVLPLNCRKKISQNQLSWSLRDWIPSALHTWYAIACNCP
jgi:hypothetical protein